MAWRGTFCCESSGQRFESSKAPQFAYIAQQDSKMYYPATPCYLSIVCRSQKEKETGGEYEDFSPVSATARRETK
jgi:hypothetical protein